MAGIYWSGETVTTVNVPSEADVPGMFKIRSPPLPNRTAESRDLYFLGGGVMGFCRHGGADGIGVSVSHLGLCPVSGMTRPKGWSGGRLCLRPRDGESEKEGSRIVASVMLNGLPCSGLGLRLRIRAEWDE